MKIRALCQSLFAVLLLSAVVRTAAEPIPAPTTPLRDFWAKGLIQIELPPPTNTSPAKEATPEAKAGEKAGAAGSCEEKKAADKPGEEKPAAKPGEKDKEKIPETGVTSGAFLVFDFEQAFVKPDCYVMATNFLGTRELSRGLANTERTFTVGSDYVVDRTFRNVDPTRESPMRVARNSMATYSKMFLELDSGKLLPDENLDVLRQTLETRILELGQIRENLRKSVDPADIPKANGAAAEQARLRDEYDQLKLRKAHPHSIVEFQNKDIMQALLAKGLMTGFTAETLDKGTTTVWITKKEGLPIKIKTTANDGRLALFIILTNFRINGGLKTSDLALGLPQTAKLITAVADLSELDWEDKLERDVATKIARLEDLRMQEKRAELFKKPKNK